MPDHGTSGTSLVGAAAAAAVGVVGVVAWTCALPALAIRRAFRAWDRGDGSIYDLMDDDAEVVIPGSGPRCGVWRKDAFIRDVAMPFMSRFATPPAPRLRAIYAGPVGVVVRADATGVTRDGRPYANAYVFVFEMRGRRVTRVTEFLDMAAFNAVWDTVGSEPSHAG